MLATYSMQIREYVEQVAKAKNPDSYILMNNRQKIEDARPVLFDFDYPIFDNAYRDGLETRIIRHFYMREMGFETEGLFKFALETKLNEIMPYYNKLFESEFIRFNPLYNTDLKTDYEKKNNRDQSDQTTYQEDQATNRDQTTDTNRDEAETTDQTQDYQEKESTDTDTDTKTDDFSRTVNDNTPDARLAITTENGEGVIEYASDISETKDNGDETRQEESKTNRDSQTDENTQRDLETGEKREDQETQDRNTQSDRGYTSGVTELEDYIQHQMGKTGTDSYSKLLTEYRNTFLRIESSIMQELEELFMLVYG